jgi:predicted ester cyclase
MSEQNKQLVRDLWGCLSSGDFEKMARIYHPDVAYHGSGGEERRGAGSVVDFARGYKVAFPDMTADVEQLVAEGDFVVSRTRPSGTNTGEMMGMAPTGKRVDLKWIMNMVRIVDGRIVEEWEVFDQMDFAKQMGMAG